MTDDRRLLIVNADDFGLTEGVSRAVLDAHRRGVVTSTSALVVGSGWAATGHWLTDHPTLGVGAHLAAVGEDPPLLSAREIPTLVDRQGRLDLSWRRFLRRAAARRIDPDDLRREFEAQVEALHQRDVRITHVDSHQNLHLWPLVRDVVLELAQRHDIPAVRVTRSAARSPVGTVVRRLARQLERAAARAGIRYPDASTGLDEAGHLDRPAMVAALHRLATVPGTSAELACHPGEAGDPALARYRWGYRWADERAALECSEVRRAIDRGGFRLGSFADLAPGVDDAGRRADRSA